MPASWRYRGVSASWSMDTSLTLGIPMVPALPGGPVGTPMDLHGLWGCPRADMQSHPAARGRRARPRADSGLTSCAPRKPPAGSPGSPAAPQAGPIRCWALSRPTVTRSQAKSSPIRGVQITAGARDDLLHSGSPMLRSNGVVHGAESSPAARCNSCSSGHRDHHCED